MKTELSVNVDHVATVRQARGGESPDPVRAAVLALDAGASGITVHLREDRRHVQDHDVKRLRALGRGVFNLEMALTEEMIGIALEIRPDRVTLVPERRAELTTEGGLALERDFERIAAGCGRLAKGGIPVSLFLDPDEGVGERARRAGVSIVEIHTGSYANARGADHVDRELGRVIRAAEELVAAGIAAHAGHGLDTANVGPLLFRHRFGELAIGHSIVSRSIEGGFGKAVREMLAAMSPA